MVVAVVVEVLEVVVVAIVLRVNEESMQQNL